MGRADETLNIAGHRIGTSEIESAATSSSFVAEVAVAPIKDEIKGENFVIFVVLKKEDRSKEQLKKEIVLSLREQIGAIAKPSEIYFVSGLPKTRSGKILRRVLRDVVQKKNVGDVTTLQDSGVVEEIIQITS